MSWLSQHLLLSKSFAITGVPRPLVDVPYTTLVPRQTYIVEAATTVGDAWHPKFSRIASYLSAPAGGVFQLTQGTATASGGNLTSQGALVATFLTIEDGKPASEHTLYSFSCRRCFPRILKLKEPVISLTGAWQGAFYHWMHQMLPRLGLLTPPFEKIYVDQSHLFQRQSLALMGLEDKVIRADQYDAIQASTLIVPSTSLELSPQGCAFLRKVFLPHVASHPKRRIYLSRGDARTRRLKNEAELLPILYHFGFENVVLSALDFSQQIEILRNAQMIVAPHGAGLSHLVFCDPGTPILELFHTNYVNPCYWQLSSLGHLPYYVLFDNTPSSQEDPDMTMDPQLFQRAVEAMIHDWSHR